MKYDEIRKDFEYLESISSNADLMEIDASVFDLMKNPTKAEAKSMYDSAIRSWFMSITNDHYDSDRGISIKVLDNDEVVRIGRKYNCDVYADSYALEDWESE